MAPHPSVQMLLLLWLAPAAALAGAWDAGEWLAATAKSDAAAADGAKCWCQELTGAVEARISAADAEVQALESSTKVRHYANEQLRLEVKSHNAEAGESEESLGVASSITARDASKSEEELADLRASLQSIRKAIDAVPSGSGGTVPDTLRSLEESFAKKLKEAEEAQASGKSRFEDLQGAKERMLRLAKRAAATVEQRLAEGLVLEAEASANLEVYRGQREADVPVIMAARDLCGMLQDQAEERAKKRQAMTILDSEVKADAAQEEAMRAAFRLTLLGGRARGQRWVLRGAGAQPANRTGVLAPIRRLSLAERRIDGDCLAAVERAKDTKEKAAELVEGAQKSARDLMATVAKSSEVQSALEGMLHEQMTTALVAQGRLAGDLKASAGGIFDLAQEQLKTLAQPFDKVRAAGREAALADSRLVTQLASARARAAEAVVEAMRCESLLQLRGRRQ